MKMERIPYALEIAYFGGPFAGWQRQAGRPSVQAALEMALAGLGIEAPLAAAGRTDAGVHARRQLVSFRVRRQLPPEATLAGLNLALPRAIRALRLARAGHSFHARASATAREYRYRVLVGGRARGAWTLPDPRSVPALPASGPLAGRLDVEAMRRFLSAQLGRQDRAPFTTRPPGPLETELHLAELRERPRPTGRGYELRFVASGYSRHLVRHWVFAAVALGAGMPLPLDALATARGWRGPRAPGGGLVLWDVDYPDDPFRMETVEPVPFQTVDFR
ncbi:MAG: tRNA pseudouridine synthase A [Deltaproteobacteria bacterium]